VRKAGWHASDPIHWNLCFGLPDRIQYKPNRHPWSLQVARFAPGAVFAPAGQVCRPAGLVCPVEACRKELRPRTRDICIFAALLLLALAAPAMASSISYTVSIDTSTIAGGVYYIDLQLPVHAKSYSYVTTL